MGNSSAAAEGRRLPAALDQLSVLIARQPTGVLNERSFAERLILYTKCYLSPLQPYEGPRPLLWSGGEKTRALAAAICINHHTGA
jgi:alkanesulfonate monooxygenase SsuD/methylene tetrahydromethanopterin reductase-like flavin-dependent oxidoreductase (luciferase family)